MNLIVLDKNLDSLAIPDTYKSFIWTDRFQKCGDFELCIPMHMAALEYIKRDYYLWSQHSEHVMIIEDIQIDTSIEDGPQLIAAGRSLESILDRRVVWGLRTLTGNFQEELKSLLYENLIEPSIPERKIENFVFEDSDDPAITKLMIETQYSGDNLYDVVTNLCIERGIGFKVTVNQNKQFVFKLYAGADRSYEQTKNPYVVFSPNFDNIIESTYVESSSMMKNVALIGGEGKGSARRYTSVGNISGLMRREMFTDAGDLSSDTGDELTEAFDFGQYASQVFDNTAKQFVSDELFNSAMINVTAYAGRKISITIPQYTGADGQEPKYATILVNANKKYVSTLQIWEKYDNGGAVNRGGLKTYEIKLPDDAEYLYSSMFSQKAINEDVYFGEITDFECASVKLSDDEYVRLMRQRGKEDLAEKNEVVTFEGQAETSAMFKYGEDFFVGDIVHIIDEYGHEVTSRVDELIVSENDEGSAMYPSFSTISIKSDTGNLPDGYTELSYIQSSGTQYINTLFAPNNYTRIIMDVEPLYSNKSVFFGSRDADLINAYMLSLLSAASLQYDYGKKQTESPKVDAGKRIVIDANKETCTIGNTSFSNPVETFNCAHNLALLTFIDGGVVNTSLCMPAKLYSCRIYDDGTLIRNYIPCTNPSGLVGLYDTVNGKFYGNSGAGAFTAGEKGV